MGCYCRGVCSKGISQVSVLLLLAGSSVEEGNGGWGDPRSAVRCDQVAVGPDEGVVSNAHHRTGASAEQGGSALEEVEAGLGEAGQDPESLSH